jgi:hypothetical protein
MDHFRLEPLAIQPAADAPYRQVAIVINGAPLLELVRVVEQPLLAAERKAAIAAGPCEGEVAPPASYMYPTVAVITRGAGEFFGTIESMFGLEPGDPQRGKTCVLGCDCGDPGCWPLLVRISRSASVIAWSAFSQFHRNWVYDLGPYQFDADAYEQELQRIRGAV